MPNTPMMVGAGCTVYCPGQKATDSDSHIVKTMLEVSGICQLVPESMIDAIGALAGCGPAYVSTPRSVSSQNSNLNFRSI